MHPSIERGALFDSLRENSAEAKILAGVETFTEYWYRKQILFNDLILNKFIKFLIISAVSDIS